MIFDVAIGFSSRKLVVPDFKDFFPDAQALVALEPEEIAGVLGEFLTHLCSEVEVNPTATLLSAPTVQDNPPALQRNASDALMEA